jgi:FtsZ-interacting cell division protein ZipA
MNETDFRVIEAYLIHGWSHRKIQSEIFLSFPSSSMGMHNKLHTNSQAGAWELGK